MSAHSTLYKKYEKTPIKDIPPLERAIVSAGAVYAVDYNAAAEELARLRAIEEAAWKLMEHPTSEAALRELARVMGVEL